MSQNSLVLPTTGTVSGLQMTQATNNAIDSLNTLSSGASAPASPQAGQFWHDTTNNIIKIRSLDNTTWIPFLQLNEASYSALPSGMITGDANRLINGGMVIDQVNGGTSYPVPNNNTPTYAADQWVVSCGCSGAGGVTAQQVADAPPSFSNSLKVTVGSGAGSVGATDFLYAYQPIEANNFSDLAYGAPSAAPASLSFWVKSSIAGTFAAVIQNAAGTRAVVNKFTITSAGVWQLIQIPNIPGDQGGTYATGTAAMVNLMVVLAVGTTDQTSTLNSWLAGNFLGSTTQTNGVLTTSGATFQITGAMLTPGVFALPYQKRLIQQELSLCQRYLPVFSESTGTQEFISIGQNINTTQGYVTLPFMAETRVAPTAVAVSSASHFGVKASGGADTALTSVVFANAGKKSGSFLYQVASGLAAGNAASFFANNAGAKLMFTGARM